MSDNPPREGRFAEIVARLHALHPRLIDLSLGRLEALLGKLDHPERRLPPVIHVAGTNGKGSTCAFLRAIAEAAGTPVHVFTSPHLVRFNERIRLAGRIVDDDTLATAIEEVERRNAGAPITVFEVITAAAFLLFSRVPAGLVVLEVGLGGRYDATNLIPPPAAAAITSISFDHRDFLGDTIAQIAGEKAGIMKPGVPVATGVQLPEAAEVLRQEAARTGARLLQRDRDWRIARTASGLLYADAAGSLELPPPGLPGPHQADNAGIAVAAIRAAGLGFGAEAIGRGLATVSWPARLQRLTGRLAATLPPGWELWLDGGHNPGAGQVLAEHLDTWGDRPVHLIVGMKQGKDSGEFLRPLLPRAAGIWAVAEPGQHLAMPVADVIAASGGVAHPGPTVAAALAAIPKDRPARVLICGSLYLAGEVLKADGTEIT
ncbi:Dihydrofolate synthase [Rhodovastum atsumiense]|uniref:tetrahydrofolate synthase n=1 Tax=Rhodovastum atsumiense TaxID=504468 RepID=A0A5M6ITZ6_9PROT|nr:folylpolyglutamate synthase/dihydrofolate synthase family protein [Rhodovastum atsumiense]KAA5610905.1 bifunctional folylpolyglutamate synthase/dihydrofolate synthase [Rhodovastum atsumiense]CAH2601529.1 Dihydrofolate synthase [Rhodovastum atsumiense]